MILTGLLILLLGVAFGAIGDSIFSIASFQWGFTGLARERLISEGTYVSMRTISYLLISTGQIVITAGILITSFALYSLSLGRKGETEKWYKITLALMATLLLIFAFEFLISTLLLRW